MRNQTSYRNVSNAFEQLESRRLLSATLEDGVLMVSGTNHSDKITLRLNHDDTSKLDVSVNGEVTQFAVADITGGVKMYGKNGKDHMMVSETEGAITLGVTMSGGNGKDMLRSASGDDELAGNNGS